MRQVTLEQPADILEVMIVEKTTNNGFAITHHGHIEGQPMIVISTCRDDSNGFIFQ